MDHMQIVQTRFQITNVLPETRKKKKSQIIYQQQQVKLAMNISHNEALNQLLMWHNLKGHNVLSKGTDVIGWDMVTFVWLPY